MKEQPHLLSLDSSAAIDHQKIQKVFSENQTALLNLLHEKRNLLSQRKMKQLQEAVRSVTLGSFDDPEYQKLFYGACNRPNAIYIPSMHKVLVCPSLSKFPELTLQQILAHELGHVIQPLQGAIPCFRGFPKSQVKEAFADWVASKVLAQKISRERDPEIAKQNAFDSQLLFLSLACDPLQAQKPDWAKTHPSLQSRVEHIFLSQPAFQEALRCHSKAANTCG